MRCTRRSATATLLNALEDRATRDAVIAADLSGSSSSSLAEQLGDAIRRECRPDSVEIVALRHALNTFRWVDPTGLPSWAPADQLAGECTASRASSSGLLRHDRNIYTNGSSVRPTCGTPQGRQAKLLLTAVRTVPAAPDTFSGVGQRMVQADVTSNSVNAKAVTDAFAATA
jgi:hypothetical protein